MFKRPIGVNIVSDINRNSGKGTNVSAIRLE